MSVKTSPFDAAQAFPVDSVWRDINSDDPAWLPPITLTVLAVDENKIWFFRMIEGIWADFSPEAIDIKQAVADWIPA